MAIDELTQRSLRWLVLTSLVYRVGVTLPAVLLNRSVLGERQSALLVIAVSVVALDGILIVVTVVRPTWLATKWVFFAADMLVAVGTTVAATVLLPRGLFLISGADLMTAFGWGTVGLWTAVRGWRVGLCMLIATPMLQLGMASLNGAPLDAPGVANLIGRTILALMNYVVPLLVYVTARQTAQTTIAASLRAGQLAVRADNLRSLHDTALAALDGIVMIAPRRGVPADERLALIIDTAGAQADRLAEVAWRADNGPGANLGDLVAGFGRRGLAIQLTGDTHAIGDADPEIERAVVGAIREALQNTSKHARVQEAQVTISQRGNQLHTLVCDSGVGLGVDWERGYGLRESVERRIRDVGGAVGITSTPNRGTSISIRVPLVRHDEVHERHGEGVRRWFPLVPLSARLIVLPFIIYKVEPLLVRGQWVLHLVVGAAAIAHGLLIVKLARQAWSPRRRISVVIAFGLDIVAAGMLYLVTALDEQTGSIITSDGATAWIYVFLTAPLWFAFGYTWLGFLAIPLLLAILPVGLALDDVHQGGGSWLFLLLDYASQVVITAGYAALVVRMARRGLRHAATESDRAGRQAARLLFMAKLRPVLRGVFVGIAAVAADPSDSPESRLTHIKKSAEDVARDTRNSLNKAAKSLTGEGTFHDGELAEAGGDRRSLTVVDVRLG